MQHIISRLIWLYAACKLSFFLFCFFFFGGGGVVVFLFVLFFFFFFFSFLVLYVLNTFTLFHAFNFVVGVTI